MITDSQIGAIFDVVIPHPDNNSSLNAIHVGERILQKDEKGFFVKWCPSEYARDGKLRNIRYNNITKNIIVKRQSQNTQIVDDHAQGE